MIIGIASGKGGTGKTTVAANLAWCAPQPVLLLDCDVEEPNCHLYFDAVGIHREGVSIPVPTLDAEKCNACGLCHRICEFNAVAFLGQTPLLFPELCHGCGGCTRVCPTGALTEVGLEIGVVEAADAGSCTLVEGRLHVGKALSPPLIRAVRRFSAPGKLTIVDSPPGTACPLAAAISGCDYAVLVAEPTRFGMHDLRLVLESIRQLGVPAGVVINRGNERSGLLYEFCRQQGVQVLAEIPESEQVAKACARGAIAAQSMPEIRRLFDELWRTLLAMAPRGAAGTESRPVLGSEKP